MFLQRIKWSLRVLLLFQKSRKFEKYRSELVLPNLNNEEIYFKPAETVDEYTQVFRLLHDCYVEKNYMQPNDIGIRITPYHLQSTVMVFIAKIKEKVIGTVTVIPDQHFGMPINDEVDLNKYRKRGLKLAEVSSLAVHRDFRGLKGEVLHRIMRYMWKFCRSYHHLDYFVCIVNPSMNTLYESIYLFEQIPIKSEISKYDFANGAPGVALIVPVGDSINKKWIEIYRGKESQLNLYEYMNTPFKKNECTHTKKYFSTFSNPIPHSLLPEAIISSLEKVSVESLIHVVCYGKKRRFTTFCKLADYPDYIIENVSIEGFKITSHRKLNLENFGSNLRIQIGPSILSHVNASLIWKDEKEAGFYINKKDNVWGDFIHYLMEEQKRSQKAA